MKTSSITSLCLYIKYLYLTTTTTLSNTTTTTTTTSSSSSSNGLPGERGQSPSVDQTLMKGIFSMSLKTGLDTQPTSFKMGPGLSPKMKRPEHDAGYTPPITVDVRNGLKLCLHLPLCQQTNAFQIWLML